MGFRRYATRILGLYVLLSCISGALYADNCTATQGMPLGPSVNQWRRWEMPLTTERDYYGSSQKGNPQRDLLLSVTFTQCGVTRLVQYKSLGFWYGLNASGTALDKGAFRIRTALPAGTWQWEVTCSKRGNALLETPDCSGDTALNRKGRFAVTASSAGNFLYKNGFLKVASSRRYLQVGSLSRGFFWLGDAAWNANLLMSYSDWQSYVLSRASALPAFPGSQFTVVQMATAPRAAGDTNFEGNPPFDSTSSTCAGDGPGPCYRWNPRFWRAVDDKIEFANQNGLVVLFAGFIEPLQKSAVLNYDTVLTGSSEAVIFAQSVAARYAGNFVIYSPGFDHKIQSNIDLIDAVGNTLGTDTSAWTARHLVTNHSAGSLSVSQYTQNLHGKDWLDFELYQSGTPGSSAAQELSQMTDRSSSMALALYTQSTVKPAINGEAVYPGQSGSYDWLSNHTPYRARETAYLSVLSGASGYSMGTCGVVNWKTTGLAGCNDPSWTMTSDDSAFTANTMKVLKSVMQSINWERLRPEPSRIQLRPGQATPTPDKRQVLAYDGSSVLLGYLAADPPSAPNRVTWIRINFNSPRPVPGLAGSTVWPSGWSYSWVSPRSGNSLTTKDNIPAPTNTAPGVFEFTRPLGCHPSEFSCDADDWILKLERGTRAQLGAQTLQVGTEVAPTSGELRIVAWLSNEAGVPFSPIEAGGAAGVVLTAPTLASEQGGNSMVVWQSDNEGVGSITGRILDSSGSPLGGEVSIATGDLAAPGHPYVTGLGDRFLVTWAGRAGDGTGPWVYYQIFDHLGTAEQPPAQVVNCEPVGGDFPRATALEDGGFVVAWEVSDSSGVYLVQFDDSGHPMSEGYFSGEGALPILESVEDGGLWPLVSFALYGSDGSLVGGGDALGAITEPGVCR